MKTFKEISEVLEMFNEYQLKSKLLNKYQVENQHTFDVVDSRVNKRIDFNDYNGKFYPNLDIIYKGYMGELSTKNIKKDIIEQIMGFFGNDIVMLNANINLINIKSLQNLIDVDLGQ